MTWSHNGSRLESSGAETISALFADALNAASGSSGTYVNRLFVDLGSQNYLTYQLLENVAILSGSTLAIENESILFQDGLYPLLLEIESGGSLNIGTSAPSDIVDTFLALGTGTSTWQEIAAAIRFNSGSSGTIQNCTIRSGGPIALMEGSSPTFENVVIKFTNSAAFRQRSTNAILRSLSIHDSQFALINAPVVFEGLSLFGTGSIGLSSSTTNDPLTISGYAKLGSGDDIGIKTDNAYSSPNLLTLLNSRKKPSLLNVRWDSDGSGATIYTGGILEFGYTFNYSAFSGGSPIEGARIYLKDSNSGNRVASSFGGRGDYSADISYTDASNASGVFAEFTLLDSVYSKPLDDDPIPTIDKRTPYSGVVAAYGYLLLALEGINPENNTSTNSSIDGGEEVSPISSVLQLVSDPFISEASPTVVAGYTSGLSSVSPDRLYDFALLDKISATNIVNPTPATKVVESSGLTAVVNSTYKLVVDESLSGISIDHTLMELSCPPISEGSTFTSGLSVTDVDLIGISSIPSVPVSVSGTATFDDSYNLSAWNFSSATVDNSTASDITITVAVGQTTNLTAANPTAGGGAIAVIEPVETTVISGFPTSNNSNGVAPNPVIGFFNNADNSWLGGLSTASPEYNGDGSFSVVLTDYLATGTINIIGDAVGWTRTTETSINVSSVPSSLSLASAFIEIVNENGEAIVGQGTAAAIARFNYNQADQRFEIAAGELDFYSAVDAAETLSSNLAGLQAFNTSIIRDVRFIENKYGREIQIPSPLTVAATEDASTSPILTDFLVLRFGNPNADLFDHGLSSTASGLTDRPEVRVTSTRFISGSVGGGGSGDATAANQTSIINALTAIQGTTFDTATDSLEALRNQGDAAWTTATGFLDATGMRSAIGLSSANLDTQLADLPTVTEFEARTLLSSAYFDPTETTVNVGAIAGNAVTNISDFHADVSGLSTLDSAGVQSAATAALTAYDPPTRTEATADKDEILDAVTNASTLTNIRVIDLGPGEEFSAGVPQSGGVGSEGDVYTVAYIESGGLRALSTDFNTSTVQANVSVDNLANSGRAHGCIYAYINGQWTLTVLTNTGDGVTTGPEYFQWRQWAIDSSGNFGTETLAADTVSPKQSGWAIATSDAYDDLTATEFYGAVTEILFGVTTDSTATRATSADLVTRTGLGAIDFSRINFPEFVVIFLLADGTYLCVALENGGTGDQNGDFGVIQEKTRPDFATAWGPDVDIDGNIAGGTATTGKNQNYAVNSSHAGQATYCQIADGRVFVAYVTNEDLANGDFGRIELIERGAASADGWTLRSSDVAGVSVRHIALSTNGSNVWIFYFKNDVEELAYRVWNPATNTMGDEISIATESGSNVFNRMVSGARFPSTTDPAVFYTVYNGATYRRYLATAPETLETTTLAAVDVQSVNGVSVSSITDFHTDLAATNTAIAAIPTTPLLTDDTRLNNLDDQVSEAVAAAQSVDGKLTTARLGYIDSLATPANFQADVSTLATQAFVQPLLDRLTVARAGYLDNLNVGGLVATATEVASNGFTASDRTNLGLIQTAAEATARGRFANDYANSEATQYDAAGSSYQVFDLLDENGDPATSPLTTVERRPKA